MIADEEIVKIHDGFVYDKEFGPDNSDIIGFARAIYQLGRDQQRELLHGILVASRKCAEWHIQDADECGIHSRALIADIDEYMFENMVD